MADRILLAEDDRLSRLSTHRILEKLGYEVEGVGDGQAAVDAEATGQFDAVIMDCQMPRMDGYQATAAIRKREVGAGAARIPIIGLSARAMEGDGEAALAKGMDVYLTKPYKVSTLQAALEQWIENTCCLDRACVSPDRDRNASPPRLVPRPSQLRSHFSCLSSCPEYC